MCHISDARPYYPRALLPLSRAARCHSSDRSGFLTDVGYRVAPVAGLTLQRQRVTSVDPRRAAEGGPAPAGTAATVLPLVAAFWRPCSFPPNARGPWTPYGSVMLDARRLTCGRGARVMREDGGLDAGQYGCASRACEDPVARRGTESGARYQLFFDDETAWLSGRLPTHLVGVRACGRVP
eukprot:CAMPEP_0174717172 /NCGR_PEP_ID=MMETSP1094-20130205/26096_1 /TAXON_ID=156173 /ORGANISM="Chrysochromulina brevifilum, Strain UTEX LB 985" /LENGTH=180 /DNA_ID=CAMNT_0015917073 /DNA_START=291 /DNA_END=834 /DNA_ORIENTATION=+